MADSRLENLTALTLPAVGTDLLAIQRGAENLKKITLADLISATGGDVVGPASATDNAVVRFDGATGKLLQNSVLIVADTTGALSGFTTGVGITLHGGAAITGASGALSFTGASTFNSTISATQLTSTIATGTAPLVVASTTQVANLNSATAGSATSAASLSISGQSGLLSVTGLASTNRIKTVRDAADTLLELGGSYTPTGVWTSMALTSPAVTTSLTTPSTTFALVNTTATTVNFAGGASTALNIGHASGATAMLGIIGFDGATPSSSTAAIFPAATTAISSLRLPHGTAPTSPVNGDMWTTTSSLLVRINGATVALGSGSGDVVGPGSATDNAVVRFDGTTGKLVQNSAVTIADTTGDITTAGAIITGSGGSVGGYWAGAQGTATTAPTSSVGFMAPASVTTAFMMTLPAAPTTGFFLNTGTSDPSTVSFVAFTGTVNVVRSTSPSITTQVVVGGLTASGSGANDFSASTGTFLTSSGANTLSGAVTIADATTPSLTTAAGKTNTGFLLINGKTSGSVKLITADATAQAVVISVAAQTSGGTTLTIPDQAGVSKNILTAAGLIAITSGKTVTFDHTSTFTTTDAQVYTFPTTTATLARTDAGQTFTGVQVFTTPTITTPNLAGAAVLAEGASIQLDPAGSADGAWSGISFTGTSGYSQAFGDVVMLDPNQSPARWELASVSAAAGAVGDCRGNLAMVVVTGTDGNSCTLLRVGNVRADANFPALTVNGAVYVTTTGDITNTQPTTTDHVIRFIGEAITADEIYFNPDKIWFTHT